MLIRRARGPLIIQVQTSAKVEVVSSSGTGARRQVKGSPCANRVNGKRNRVNIDSLTGARTLPRPNAHARRLHNGPGRQVAGT